MLRKINWWWWWWSPSDERRFAGTTSVIIIDVAVFGRLPSYIDATKAERLFANEDRIKNKTTQDTT